MHRYRVVDVFTEAPLEGNPLAVFPNAAGFDGETMQRIARELSLSETAFILPPTRPSYAARVRIFTPARELSFAGHPTIGAAYVLMRGGMIPEGSSMFRLEEKVGAIPIRIEAGA